MPPGEGRDGSEEGLGAFLDLRGCLRALRYSVKAFMKTWYDYLELVEILEMEIREIYAAPKG